MKIKPTVFIICPVHNDLAALKGLLRSIKSQSYRQIETLIVDDGSTDGTAQYIKKHYPQVKILAGDGRLWWTGAMYWAVSEVLLQAKSGDFVLTLNSDCSFAPNYVKALVEMSRHYNKAMVGSLAVDIKDHDRIWDGGVKVDWAKGKFIGLLPARVKDLPNNKIVVEVDTMGGRGTLVPIEVFKKIGNYRKDKLPHYSADYEFGLRAKQAGLRLILSYKAKVYNHTEKTGLGSELPPVISIKQLWSLLFSRRSRVNIVDQWRLIWLACPPRYRPINIARLLAKVVHYLLHVPPFTLVPHTIKKSKKLLGIEHDVQFLHPFRS